MKPIFALTLGLLLLLSSVSTAGANPPPLVDAQWAQNNLGSKGVVFLDIQELGRYVRFHIPGAVSAPYDRWRTSDKGEPKGMMPPAEQLAEMIGGLGIDNETTVVIVATGSDSGDAAAAARVFWTFKTLGHDKVAVLDGGLLAFAQLGKGGEILESGLNKPEPLSFKANPRADFAVTADSTLEAIGKGAALVDARSTGEFVGLYVGDDKERPGTIPGSRNLPFDWVTDGGSGKLRSVGALRELFKAVGLATEGEQIHFCHTGNRAALTWFVSYALLGNEQAKLYDASMMEWARRNDLPMDQKIKLCEAC